jgi:hypothetical protein
MRALAGQRSPHQWIAAVLALAIPSVIAATFLADVDDAHDAPEQIIYVNSWKSDRSIEETRAAIKDYEVRRKAAEEERQRSFQKLEAGMNKLGIN